MYNEISMEQLKTLMRQQKINLVDIRDNYQYQLGRIPGAINIPMNFLLTVPDNYLNKNEVYYLYCEQGVRSKRACQELSQAGYQVVNVVGGYSHYQ